MDTYHIIDKLRICPGIQQGGTQTIQQSIYLTHDNPCGANKLIFQEMGFSGIRYIDLKNYLDEILGAEEMRQLFEQVRTDATNFMNNPLNEQIQNKYLYSLSQWGQNGILNLPVPINEYKGYEFSFSVFDGSGCLLYDSNSPTLHIINKKNDIYTRSEVSLTRIYYPVQNIYVPSVSFTYLYKLCNNYILMPFVQQSTVVNSNYIINQLSLPETIMAVSSLLVDSANTRTFGVPKYGFSNRSNQLQVKGLAYYCCHIIDINSIPDENEETTLVENIFVRLALAETTPPNVNFAMSAEQTIQPLNTSVLQTKQNQENSAVFSSVHHTEQEILNPKYRLLSFMNSLEKN